MQGMKIKAPSLLVRAGRAGCRQVLQLFPCTKNEMPGLAPAHTSQQQPSLVQTVRTRAQLNSRPNSLLWFVGWAVGSISPEYCSISPPKEHLFGD